MGILEGRRIRLRPIEKADLPKLNQWKNDEEIYRNLGGGFQPVSMNVQEKWLESLMDTTGNNKRFMIMTDREAIGMIGLYSINWIHRTCELGIFIGDRGRQGNGYGQEAYRLLEEYAGKYLNIRKINAWVVEDNPKAMRMYEQLGFQKVGVLTAERYINGAYHSVAVMEKFLHGGGINITCFSYRPDGTGGLHPKRYGGSHKMRITIRKFKEEDIENKIRWINNPANNQYLHYDLPLEYEKTRMWFENIRNHTDRYDAVIEADKVPVGLIGLLSVDTKNKKAEYYISVGETDYKRKGIALEASKLLLAYGFQAMGLERVYLFTETDNLAAQKLFLRLGFQREGLLRKDVLSKGKYVDRMIFGLLREEYHMD